MASEGYPTQPSSLPFFCEEEVPFFTKIRQHTVLTSVEVCAPAPLPTGVYCVWALCTPVPCRLPADLCYTATSAFVVGSVSVTEEDAHRSNHNGCGNVYTLRFPLTRWELQPGTTLLLHVAAANARVEAVVTAMTTTRRRAYGLWRPEVRGRTRTPRVPSPTTEAELAPLVRLRLSGFAQAEVLADDQVEWIPFVVRRWFELSDPDQGEATLVFRPSSPPTVEGRSIVSGEAAETYFSLFSGGVKEAMGIDPDGAYVRWCDGSIGLMQELKPYARVFTPARREKVARVRRFPHRHADVIGELPFECRALSIGQQTDPFTNEVYTLLVLPDEPSLMHLVELYGLPSLSPSQWLWGWSKIAGTSGVPLLRDVTTETEEAPRGLQPLQLTAPHLLQGASVAPGALLASSPIQLPPGTFYTPTRQRKSVRIRSKASLKSAAIGEVESNEVKEALRELVVCSSAVPEAAKGGHGRRRREALQHAGEPVEGHGGEQRTTFIEWKAGGFSLKGNEREVFLRRLQLLSEAPLERKESPAPPGQLAADRKREREDN